MRSESEAGDLSRALEEYLTEREAGLNPDAFLSRYPELADELRPCLTALELIGAAGAGDGAAVTDVAERSIGDFRLVREIGRGGMGVVYEAEQVSLDRRVALKVLPFAAVLDERHLRRFRNEARAAAHLHHTHIVPVYSVGVERGVHYYAMQFIDGLAVDDLVAELRWSTGRPAGPRRTPTSSSAAVQAVTGGSDTGSGDYCRSIARLGVQAARALDHAHEQGIVHRDIKPANLLVDATGHLWVTDFGLASFRDRPGPTMTGDLVGTVRYMSPEQALASRAVVDHRTDVYSLGVTLYELITLEQAFPGDEAHRIIQDIAFRDPVPARRHNSAVPAEIETILGKAVSKSPDDRYATAADMAEDLERFLEDRPIRARRPGPLKRATMWSARHRAVVRAGLVVLLLSVVGLAVTTAIVANERADAIEARDEALRARDEATAAHEEVQAARQKMEQHFERSVAAIEAMLGEIGGERLAYVPQMEPVRREMLRKAVDLYMGLMADRGEDHKLRFWAAHARRRLGDVHALMRDPESAAREIRGAFDEFSALAEEFDCSECRLASSRALTTQAMDRARRGQGDEAKEMLRRSLGILEAVPRTAPEGRVADLERGVVLHNLASVLSNLGHLAESEDARLRCLRIREAYPDERTPDFAREDQTLAVAVSRFSLGGFRKMTLRLEEAEQEMRRAVAIVDGLGDEADLEPITRQSLAQFLMALGNVLAARGKLEEAEATVGRAERIARRLAGEHPSTPEHRVDLASALIEVGNVRAQTRGDLDEVGLEATRAAVRILEGLRRDFPGYPDDAHALGAALHNLSTRILFENPEEARDLGERAVACLRVAVAARPRHLAVRRQFHAALRARAAAVQRLGPPEAALKAHQDHLAALTQFVRDFEGDPAVRSDLRDAEALRGTLLLSVGKVRETLPAYEAAVQIGRELVEEEPSPVNRKKLAYALEIKGDWLKNRGRFEESEKDFREALDLRRLLREEAGDDPEHHRLVALSLRHLGVLASARARFTEALPYYEAVLRIYEDLAGRFPDARMVVLGRLNALLTLGGAQLDGGQVDEGLRTLERAETECRAADPGTDPIVADFLVKILERKGFLAGSRGQPMEALKCYRQVVDHLAARAERTPGQHPLIDRLACARLHLGQALWQMFLFPAAEKEIDEAVRLLDDIFEDGYVQWAARLHLLHALGEQGRFRAACGKPDREILDRMLGLMRELGEKLVAFPSLVDVAASAGRSAGMLAMQLRDPEKAEEAFRWTLTLEEPVVDGEPGLTCLVRDACMRAACLAMLGHAQDALEAAERILERDPTRPLAMHTVASLLTEHPDAARRQPERALKLVTATVEACERTLKANPMDPDARVVAACMWNTLGLARIRTGDHAGAIEAVRKQMGVGNPEPIADWLVLALAHALRGEEGDAEEANRWFEKARAWRKSETAPRKDLLRLYDEVEAAL